MKIMEEHELITFEEICDFNICEEDKDLGDYKARFLSKYLIELHNPRENNWIYSEPIEDKLLDIMDKREEEFDAPDEYDYMADIQIKYQIIDKSSGHSSGDMEHHIRRSGKTKEEFKALVEEISIELNKTFKEKLVIMYNFKIFTITLSCNFYVI